MAPSFKSIVRGVVCAVGVLAVVSMAGRATAQSTGCCIGPTCSNQDARTCAANSGTALDSACKNANDPRCGSCADIPETAPRGLCNAYCDRLDCPAGKQGMACEQLRKNWLKATGLKTFPCDVPDRAACCQCPGAGPTCASARRCLKAQCQIIDRCIDGKCPEPQCCECSTEDGPVCGDRIPGVCKRLGCTPEPGAVCTENSRCEQCPCGTDCKDAAGNVGRCVNVPGAAECECQVPAPCGYDAAGQCGGKCEGSDECMVVTDAAGNVKCECAPPCGRTGSGQCGGTCSTSATPGYVCEDVEGDCKCVPPPDPCLNRSPCDATCVDPSGNKGICRETDGGCRCLKPPTECPETAAACAGPCVTAANEPGKCTPGVNGAPPCTCQTPPESCDTSNPETCSGLCTVAGTLCLPDLTDPNPRCRCQPPPTCAASAPQCGGPCPEGRICAPTATGGACECVPLPCDKSTAPTCGGFCPAPQSCQNVPSPNGDVCQCLPEIPCTASTAPQCGGFCPEGLTCTSLPNGGPCECQTPQPCELSAPACGGDCPAGSHCTAISNGCVCRPDVQ